MSAPPDKGSPERRTVADRQRREFVPIDATKCKWCTADIEPGAPDEDAPQIASENRVADWPGRPGPDTTPSISPVRI